MLSGKVRQLHQPIAMTKIIDGVLEKNNFPGASFTAFLFATVGTAGQCCTTCRRLLLHESIYHKEVERLLDVYMQIKIGDPLEKGILLGPLHRRASRENFEKGIQKIISEILTEGSVIPSERNFVQPTIVEISPSANVVKEELFGPVLYVMKFKACNSALWNGCLPWPKQVWSSASGAVLCWSSLKGATAVPTAPLQAQEPQLEDGILSCFFDASFSPDALMAETLACKKVLSWLRDRGLSPVALYTDCMNLHRYLSSSSIRPRSHIGITITDCLAISSSFAKLLVLLF